MPRNDTIFIVSFVKIGQLVQTLKRGRRTHAHTHTHTHTHTGWWSNEPPPFCTLREGRRIRSAIAVAVNQGMRTGSRILPASYTAGLQPPAATCLNYL
jgi:hypothetical protein